MATTTLGPISAPMRDVLGEPWQARVIAVDESRRAPGADRAILVHQEKHATRDGGAPLPRAALYLPGFADTFFQTAHAEQWIDAGIEYYALDCRAQGRAGVALPRLELIYDLRLRFEEIAHAIRYMHSRGHRHVTLIGHSTGGLQAIVYAADHPLSDLDDADPDAVILNSPWFDAKQPEPIRTLGTLLAHSLSHIAPSTVISYAAGHYPSALHVDHGGEWSFDVDLKPIVPFPARAGFISSVRSLQRQLTKGLGVQQPVFLACASEGGIGDRPDSPDLKNTDVVLDPADMVRLAPRVGADVLVRQFADGIHDLACARRPVRDQFTRAAIEFALNH